MVKSAQTSIDTWDRDNPWVVVSQRQFCFDVPASDLGGPPVNETGLSEDQIAERKNATKRRLWTVLGAGFICADVSSWGLMGYSTAGQDPPKSMPNEQRGTIELRCDEPALRHDDRFMDGQLRKHSEVEAVLLAAFRSLGAGRKGASSSEITANRFVTQRGAAVPEIVVIRAKDIFGSRRETEDSRFARVIVELTIPYVKDPVHLGALHDFAVMQGSYGRAIADKCRARGRSFGYNT